MMHVHPSLTRAHRRTNLLAALSAAAFACTSCGGSQATTPADSASAPVSSGFESAHWRDETIVLDAETLEAELQNPDSEDGVYRFDPGSSALATLAKDQVLVLSGLDLVKVIDVDRQPDAIVVTSAPASLADALSDGVLSWEGTSDFSRASFSGGNVADKRATLIKKLPDKPQTFAGKIAGFDVKQSLSRSGEDLKLEFEISYKKGTAVFKVVASGTLKPFVHSGSAQIDKGELVSAALELKDLSFNLDMNLGGVALGAGDSTFSLPVEIKIPYPIGPIPTYVSVGGKFNVYPSLSETSSSRGKAHFQYKTDSISLKLDGGKLMPFAQGSMSKVTFMDYEAVSTVTSGLGVLADFPRIAFGVGLKQAGGTLYMTVKNELVTNFEAQFSSAGGFPVLSANCFTADLNMGAYAGGELKLLDLKLTREQAFFTKTEQLVKKGEACKAAM